MTRMRLNEIMEAGRKSMAAIAAHRLVRRIWSGNASDRERVRFDVLSHRDVGFQGHLNQMKGGQRER